MLFKMNSSRLVHAKYCFLIFNFSIIISSVFCFIYGNFNFAEKFIFSGTFIGGHLCSVALPFLLYGSLGIYASLQRHRQLLILYVSIGLTSLIIRNLSSSLSSLHRFHWYNEESRVFWGIYEFFEIFSVLNSCVIILYDDSTI